MYNCCKILAKPLRHVVTPLFCLGNIGIHTFCGVVEKVGTNFSHTCTLSWSAHLCADGVVAHNFVVFCTEESLSCMLLLQPINDLWIGYTMLFVEGNSEFQNDDELVIYSLCLFDQNMPIHNGYTLKMANH